MTWTRFMDMHSGGGRKGPADKILIEAPEAEAQIIFYNRFGLNPERVSCTCCGDDYSVSESETLELATAFDRGCRDLYFYKDDGTEVPGQTERWARVGEYDSERESWVHDGREIEDRYVERGDATGYRAYRTLDEYLTSDDVLVVRADEITPEERIGSIPQSGYVWVDA